MMKKKLQPIRYAITRTEASYQFAVIELMKKLVQQTRESNLLLRELLTGDTSPRPSITSQQLPILRNNASSGSLQTTGEQKEKTEEVLHRQVTKSRNESKAESVESSSILKQERESPEMRKMMEIFQGEMRQISETNRNLINKLMQVEENKSKPKVQQSPINTPDQKNVKDILTKMFIEKQKRKGYSNYGIISEIMPFSDKRQIKVRFSLHDIIQSGELQPDSKAKEVKPRVTEWLGMVFRATASICWNMLLNGSLSFEEVKVLFTENIIFNYIELMNDLQKYIADEERYEITEHINEIARLILEFLCRQYPQTKIEAPNIALKKAIPIIENQGQIKYDIVSMVLREFHSNSTEEENRISFQLREDKDYSSSIMKTINYMIGKTDQQYGQFEKIMSGLFEQIYLPKEQRNLDNLQKPSANIDLSLNQYREKVKNYSSYAIGRKIPKNTPKYTDMEIQSGVFFVKAPSILRIITKWVEELHDFVLQTNDQEKGAAMELMNHQGRVINMSSRVQNLLFQKIQERLPKIQNKINSITEECYSMEFFLSGNNFVNDANQIHLSQDQLCVGKFCSNLRHAISSYVCSQLSKLIYYTSQVPMEIDEQVLVFGDQDSKEQARKHLDSVNLVSLKIFDLLRCKCHSNEEEIIWIVEALKDLEKRDKKFQIVRVKDRLNQGTRDILINASYDGGLVWEIQLAVTSNVDKKQDLLDKYNHFLYELKRAKLGPLSQCVTIWSSLEQRSIYFEQLNKKKKVKGEQSQIKHKRNDCKGTEIVEFEQFKRPIICSSCQEYFSIPTTSLLNVRCQSCKVTYCGMCFYESLSALDKKKFMFQNFWQKKLLTKGAFDELEQYTDFKKPFPKEGFFIKKNFLNRELSYYTVVEIGAKGANNETTICLAQTIHRGKKLICRMVHKKYLKATIVDGEYHVIGDTGQLLDLWIFYFPRRKPEIITIKELENEIRKPQKFGTKYLNVLEEPSFMLELQLIKKSFQKNKLILSLMETEDLSQSLIGVHRFNNFTILANFVMKDSQLLKQTLVTKNNKQLLKKYAEKKMEILHLEDKDISNQFQLFAISQPDFANYFEKISKLHLADNHIQDISFMHRIKNLQVLSISKNCLKSLKGVESLIQLTYLKFDSNSVSSLEELSNLVSLSYISGNNNRVNSLKGLENIKCLTAISLCSNKIESLSELTSLKSLIRAYFRSNPIEDIEPLKDLLFKHLYLGQTQIKPEIIRSFSCVSSIEELSLKGINLTVIPSIFDKMVNLSELKLSKNKIKKIENIDMLVTLVRLDLSQNEIQKIQNLDHLVHLEDLKLKSNRIKVLSGVKTFMESLHKLHLQGNPLEDVAEYLMFQDQTNELMKLKYTPETISEKAAAQIKNHYMEINIKSDLDE